jgi:sugar phosphate permease
MVTGALRQGMPALGPAVRDAFALSLGQVGLVFGALALGMTLSLVPFGALADRVGERPVLAGGLVATAGALGIAALAGSFAVLVAGLFATGLAGASATGASGRAVMGWFGRRERGLALGIRQTAIPLGGALAALTLPPVALAAGLEAAFAALAGFTLVAALAGALWLREPPPAPSGRAVVDAPPPLRDARVWRLGVGSGLLVVAQAAVIGFLVLFLTDARGLSLATAAAALAAVQVGAAVARIAVGRWSDLQERRIAPLRHAGLAGALLLALAAVLSSAPSIVLLPVLLAGGIAISSWNGLAFTAAAELSGRDRAGTAMALQNTVVSLLGAAASPLFGALVDLTSWGTAYLVAALAPLVGWLVLRPLVPDEERRAAARGARAARAAAAT